METSNLPKVDYKGVHDLGEFKLDHFQPFELILFEKISTLLPSYWGSHFLFPLIERGKKEGAGAENGKKGNHPKMDDTQGFLHLGHSNWTICSLLSWVSSKKFPFVYLSYWGLPFLITPERRKEGTGAENEEKGITQKWMRHRSF